MRGSMMRRLFGYRLRGACSVASAARRLPRSRRATPRAVAVRRSQIRSRLQAFRLRQPGRAEGRHDAARRRSAPSTRLNPYVVKGVPAAGIGQTFDTLMVASEDEPGSEYGLVAESVDLAPDKLSVLYTLRKEARFHDGTPMTPEDVIWTFETLRDEGPPDVPLLLRRRDQGREGGRARRPVLVSNRRKTANCRRSSGRCRCCRRNTGPGATSRRRRSIRRSAAAPTRSNRSIPAARSPIAASPITGRPICRSSKGRYNVDTIRYDYYRDGDDRARSLQGRPIRRAAGELVESLGDRV